MEIISSTKLDHLPASLYPSPLEVLEANHVSKNSEDENVSDSIKDNTNREKQLAVKEQIFETDALKPSEFSMTEAPVQHKVIV